MFVLIARGYSVEDYGTFRQIWMITKDLAVGCFALGVPMGILYYLSVLQKPQKHGFIVQSVLLLAILGVAASVLVYLAAPQIAANFENEALESYLRIFAFYPAILLPTLALESVYISFNKTPYYALFIIVSKATLLICVTLLVMADAVLGTLLKLILGFALAELCASLIMIHYLSKPFKGADAGIGIKQQFLYSAPIGMSTIVNILNVELDKFIVSLRLGVEQFAVYANGAMVVPFISTFAGAATSALMPHLVNHYENDEVDKALVLWRATIVKLAILFYPLIAFLLVFAESFIVLLFSESYESSAPVFQIYLASQLPKIIFFGPFLMALGKRMAPLIGALVGLFVNALLSWWSVDVFGLVGPALATVFSVYAVTAYYIYSIKEATGSSTSSVFPFQECLKILGISTFVAVVMHFVASRIFDSLDNIFIFGFAYLFHFVIILIVTFKMNILTQEDMDFLRGISRRFLRI